MVAFMGVGLILGAEIYTTSTQRDKEKTLLAVGRQFRVAIGRYHQTKLVNGQHEYPMDLGDLLQDNRSAGVTRHLRKIFVDPMTAKSEWGVLRLGGKIVGVHSLSDVAPIKQDGFEAADVSFTNKKKYSEWVFTYPPDLLLSPHSDAPTPKDTVPAKQGVDAVPKSSGTPDHANSPEAR
jgi:hypothetical protein